MDTTNTIALSAAVATVITTLVVKMIDIIQKKSEFKRELKKLFFLNKLKSAEDVFGVLGIALSGMLEIKLFLTELIDPLARQDPNYKLNADDRVRSWKESSSKVTQFVSTFGLYFDVQQVENLDRFAHKYKMEARVFDKLFLIYENSNLAGREKALSDCRRSVSTLTSLIRSMEELIREKMKWLREQFKGYEVQ